MSNTIYVDINAQNSRLNETNNILNYTFPEQLSCPTGTQIRMLQTIINQQGSVGTSITLDEDIEESMIIQYYVVDTDINVPSPALNTSTTLPLIQSWQLYDQMSQAFNAEKSFGYNTGNPATGSPYGTIPYGQASCGGTEIIMPLVRPCNMDSNGTGTVSDANQYLIPFTAQIFIKIAKGTYNVNKLAEIITDQINGSDLAFRNNESTQELLLQDEKFSGFLVNDTTLKNVKIFKDEKLTDYNDTGTKPAEWVVFDALTAQPPRPLEAGESFNVGLTAIAVHPEVSSEIRIDMLNGKLGSNVQSKFIADNFVNKNNADCQFFRGFELPYQPGSSADVIQKAYLGYNVMSNGIGVGSSNFQLKVNTDGEFEVDYCHTPRYIPTYDFFGNRMENAGQECAYRKGIAGIANSIRNDEFPATRSAAGHAPIPIGNGWLQTQQQPMTRTTGFMVLNWAYKTCFDNSSRGIPEGVGFTNEAFREAIPKAKLVNMDKNATYDEWFKTKEEARKTWEKTLWFKLGFSYDDLQNPENFEKQYYPDIANFDKIAVNQIDGFTTNERIDSSAITSASTLVNGNAHSSSGAYTPSGGINPINGNISGIQIFNTADINIPYDIYNNNAKQEVQYGNTTGAYKGSFFYGAVMVPIITSGIPVSASKLPTLNSNGYMIVSSDLVEPNDVVKKNSFIGLMDIVPKSNLQNTDYVQDRNVLVHTLSNPKVVNGITIKVQNPDLTDIELEPNSAFLLQVTFPQPKQTTMLANLEYNTEEQAVANSINQQTAQAIEKGQAPDFRTFNPYTAEPQPITQEEAERTPAQESRRRIEIAKRAVRVNKLRTEEQKQDYLSQFSREDVRRILEVAERMRASKAEARQRDETRIPPVPRERGEHSIELSSGEQLTPRQYTAHILREFRAGRIEQRQAIAEIDELAREGRINQRDIDRAREGVVRITGQQQRRRETEQRAGGGTKD